MHHYQHYSFDLWLTLIKSNPLFKKQRSLFFYNYLNHQKKSLHEVECCFRKTDIMCNAINEKTGNSIAAEDMYLMVISRINNDNTDFSNINISELYNEMEQLLFRHLPLIYCDNTVNTLGKLKAVENTTLNILSNTGFIKGNSLRKILKMVGLDRFFDFQLYSDETGISKPDIRLFQHMINTSKNMRSSNILSNEIVHVGDNPVADIQGATAAGIRGVLINSNSVSISSLVN